LCSRHHRLLHEGEFTIQKDFEGNWYFRNRSGKIIPQAPFFIEPDDAGVLPKNEMLAENPPRGGLEKIVS
jgi:hypothetical protein